MLFQMENCLLYAHRILKQLEALKMTIVRQVILPEVVHHAATLPAHQQVYALYANSTYVISSQKQKIAF